MNPSEPADPLAPTRGFTRWTTPCTSTCPACPTANRAAMRAPSPAQAAHHRRRGEPLPQEDGAGRAAHGMRSRGSAKVSRAIQRDGADVPLPHARVSRAPEPVRARACVARVVWERHGGHGGWGWGWWRGLWGKGRRWGLGFGLGGDASGGGAPRRRARLQHVPRERVPGVVAGAHAVGHTRGRGPVVAAFPGCGDRISPARRLLKNAR